MSHRPTRRFGQARVRGRPGFAGNRGCRCRFVGRSAALGFFQQPQATQSAKECEDLAMRNFAAGFDLECLPDGCERVGAVRGSGQPKFIGREDMPDAGSDIDDRYVGVANLGFITANDLQVGPKPVARTWRCVRAPLSTRRDRLREPESSEYAMKALKSLRIGNDRRSESSRRYM